jgi:transposase
MHGISSGRYYTWRKQFRSSAVTGFMPVLMEPDIPALPAPAPVEAQPAAFVAGSVEVELPNGIKLRVTGGHAGLAERPLGRRLGLAPRRRSWRWK